MTEYILQFHSLGSTEKVRADFNSENSAEELIRQLNLEGYKMYQYILSEYTYNMSVGELGELNVPFAKLDKVKKTWFGLSKKTVSDLFITPKNGFFYPYQYGNYLYIFSKREITKTECKNWLDREFPSQLADLDYTFAGFNSEYLKLMNADDYLIVTCHDYQEQLGISGSSSVISELIIKLNKLNLTELELDKYQGKSGKKNAQ